jgi:RNA polymerase sigma-70 factor, ECF subfamily
MPPGTCTGSRIQLLREGQDAVGRLAKDQVGELLRAWSDGDTTALEKLTPIVYDELHRLARRYMKGERPGHSLQTTALVNEAYLRLVDVTGVDWQDRAHFFAVSAKIMRRILVDAARTRAAEKRGGRAERLDHSVPVDLDQFPAPGSDRASELCALDDALEALGQMDPRRAQVIELRFFGGLTVEETAEVLAISPQSVMRDWKLARAWLTRELRHQPSPARET